MVYAFHRSFHAELRRKVKAAQKAGQETDAWTLREMRSQAGLLLQLVGVLDRLERDDVDSASPDPFAEFDNPLAPYLGRRA